MVFTSYGVIPDSSLVGPRFPSLPSMDFDSNLIFENLPAKLTPKLAYFVGYFFGDGGVKDIQKTFKKRRVFEYKIMVADEFEIQMKIIQNLFFDLFGIKPPIRYERILKGERTYYINPTNKSVYLFLTTLFGFPKTYKYNKLRIPKIILKSPSSLKRWFVRGVFDADGDTRAVEKGFTSQSRVKLRMKSHHFIRETKSLLEECFKVSVNGPYFDKNCKSSYIQIERFDSLKTLNTQNLFLHPIKRWRLTKSCSNLISSHKAQLLKQFT